MDEQKRFMPLKPRQSKDTLNKLLHAMALKHRKLNERYWNILVQKQNKHSGSKDFDSLEKRAERLLAEIIVLSHDIDAVIEEEIARNNAAYAEKELRKDVNQ